MRHEDFGCCATCRHWAVIDDAERHGEVLPDEPEHYRSPGFCRQWGDESQGSDVCPDYHRREDHDA